MMTRARLCVGAGVWLYFLLIIYYNPCLFVQRKFNFFILFQFLIFNRCGLVGCVVTSSVCVCVPACDRLAIIHPEWGKKCQQSSSAAREWRSRAEIKSVM